MALIRIVETSELRPELSLRASDYINNKDSMNAFNQRLDTGKTLDKDTVEELVKPDKRPVPALAVDQLWEATFCRRAHDMPVRKVRIVAIGDTHAIVENVITGNRTKVRLAAFRGRTKKDYYPADNGS